MATIVKGTTPTIKYTFNVVDPTDIITAYLTIKQQAQVVIEKDLESATVGDKFIAWKFSQAETLDLFRGKITARLNWKTTDGTRGCSERDLILIDENEKNEVI